LKAQLMTIFYDNILHITSCVNNYCRRLSVHCSAFCIRQQ
jgi:hypothetical protein